MRKSSLTLLFISASVILFSCGVSKDPLPNEFYGLKRTNKLSGTGARDFVDQLHMRSVAAEKNEIGFYDGERGNAVIYVSYYKDPETATDEINKMTTKISPGNSMFSGGEIKSIIGNPVYEYFGMGQNHYLFQKYKKVVWVSADTSFADGFIKEYLKYISKE